MHIGIEDLRFRTSTLSRPTWHSVKVPRSQCRIVGTELGMLLAVKAQGRVRAITSDLLLTMGL
jgi:hypothetical protein